MKPVIIALMMLFIARGIAAQGNPKTDQTKKEKLENVVLGKVSALWEVKAFMRRARASKPMLMISSEPDSTFKYYAVSMGASNFDIFRTTERFCVDPQTLKVYYWDVMADDAGFSNSAIIPITQWRLLRTTPGWQKPHTYKHGKLVALAK
ncbi:MAG: hypothetical protein V4592_24690 [Bacteroidota bacterium]